MWVLVSTREWVVGFCRRSIVGYPTSLVGLVALVLLFARPVVAQAHAILLSTDPADGSVVATPPTAVRLTFSEPVHLIPDTVVVLDPSGRRVDRGLPVIRDSDVRAMVAASSTGTYVVEWRVISDDTHPASGRLTFSVGTASTPTYAEGASFTALGLPLQVLARWLHELGYALGFGSLAFGVLVLRPLVLDDADAERRLWRLVTIGVVLLVVAEPAALLAQVMSLGSGGLPGIDVTVASMSSSFGRVLAQRLAAALLLWVFLGVLQTGTARAVWAALALGAALALVDGEASHAVSTPPAFLGLALNAVHVAASGVWVGGLLSLLWVWRMMDLRVRRTALVARFGRVAAWSIVCIGLSGVAMAALHLSAAADLFETGYGRALSIKTTAVLVGATLALVGTRTAGHHRSRWLGGEAVVLLGVLALAGLVVSLPPVR